MSGDQTKKSRFEEIKTSSKFGGKKSGYVKTRFVKPYDEPIIFNTKCYQNFTHKTICLLDK